MKKINYRLIVSDFDGTLYTSKYDIPERVKSAIREYVDCGGVFAVVTGRMLKSILPRVRELGLKGIVVAYQGTVIADIQTGKLIKDGSLTLEQSVEIIKTIEDCGEAINAYSDEILFSNLPKEDEHLRLYERITGVQAESVTDIPLSLFIKNRGIPCRKIASLVAPKNQRKLYEFLKEKYKDRFDVTCSASVLVELSPLGDDKGAALKYLADYYNIPLNSTVAIGDNLNDLSMIKAAQIGVAVANGDERLKEQADEVTVSNDEGAVAQIIQKYGFV